MRVTRAAGVAALIGTIGLPAALAAQPGGVGAACNIDVLSPKELATLSSIKIPGAKAATDAGRRQAALRDAMKELSTKPQRFEKNPAGHQYVIAQALTLWAIEPGVPHQTTRGALGFVDNPEQPIDILVELDKAFSAIVAAQPACEEDVKGLRQNEAWLAMTRAALEKSNTQQFDSAGYYARRALLVSKSNPYPNYILGNVLNQQDDKKGAVENWKRAIALAGTDTSYADVVAGARYYAALTELELAQSASGDEQKRMARDAAGLLRDHLAADPKGADASNILGALADALQMAGDTAAIPGIYKPLLDDPAGHSDIMLATGGMIAARSNRTDDALALFEGSLRRNPNSRDALTNVAATYYGKEQYEKMFAPARALTQLDPNNPDAWMLLAYAAQGLAKAAPSNCVAGKPCPRKDWTDTLVKYQSLAEELPVKVDVSNFTRNAESVILIFSVSPLAKADGGDYQLTVEFLDAAGGVVATETKPVSLAKGDRKSVRFDVKRPGIVAYRYKPIT
jgi:tetratricopeptide (TPR) repeat protein